MLAPGTELEAPILRAPGAAAGSPIVVREPFDALPYGARYRADQDRIPLILTILDQRLARHGDTLGAVSKAVSAAAKIEHQALLPIYGVGLVGNQFGVIEADPRSSTLATFAGERLARNRPIDSNTAIKLIGDVCDAVEALHRAAIHGFITSDTVLVSRTGRIFVSNCAIAVGVYDSGVFAAVAPNIALAPEQRNDRGLTASTDTFAIAALCVELLTGCSVGRADRSLAELGLLGPAALVEALQSALAADPALRPASASALKRSLLEGIRRGPVERDPSRAAFENSRTSVVLPMPQDQPDSGIGAPPADKVVVAPALAKIKPEQRQLPKRAASSANEPQRAAPPAPRQSSPPQPQPADRRPRKRPRHPPPMPAPTPASLPAERDATANGASKINPASTAILRRLEDAVARIEIADPSRAIDEWTTNVDGTQAERAAAAAARQAEEDDVLLRSLGLVADDGPHPQTVAQLNLAPMSSVPRVLEPVDHGSVRAKLEIDEAEQVVVGDRRPIYAVVGEGEKDGPFSMYALDKLVREGKLRTRDQIRHLLTHRELVIADVPALSEACDVQREQERVAALGVPGARAQVRDGSKRRRRSAAAKRPAKRSHGMGKIMAWLIVVGGLGASGYWAWLQWG